MWKNQNLFSLCLGLQIYYTSRSKKNIDILFRMGYSSSYDEIRMFLTSVAHYNLKINNGTYIPRNLQKVEENNFIRASIDNFDLNEETVDGKNTTHCMATVVFQNKPKLININEIKIPRHKFRSLHHTQQLDNKLQTYKKKNTRPEPPKQLKKPDLELFKKKDNIF